jgi:hypothetical protein
MEDQDRYRPANKLRTSRPRNSLRQEPSFNAFVNVVSTHAASHFKPGDLELLCRYAEAAAAAEEAAFQMAQPGGMVTTDGKVSPWFAIHQQATKTLNALALRLRIGPQSRARTQSKKEPAPMSYYDRMRMQRDWDKFP